MLNPACCLNNLHIRLVLSPTYLPSPIMSLDIWPVAMSSIIRNLTNQHGLEGTNKKLENKMLVLLFNAINLLFEIKICYLWFWAFDLQTIVLILYNSHKTFLCCPRINIMMVNEKSEAFITIIILSIFLLGNFTTSISIFYTRSSEIQLMTPL